MDRAKILVVDDESRMRKLVKFLSFLRRHLSSDQQTNISDKRYHYLISLFKKSIRVRLLLSALPVLLYLNL